MPLLIIFCALLSSFHDFPSIVIHQSHAFIGYHDIDINSPALFFTYFTLFKYVAPSHKPNMNNSYKSISTKIIITKARIIAIYTNKANIIPKEYHNTTVCIIKAYIIIIEYNFISSLIELLHEFYFWANQSGKNCILV